MKKKQKGFTLVELLVVIAILAVLATVSILGYTSFTRKATISNDEAIAAQINLVLQANEAEGKPNTLYEALQLVFDAGYDVTKLTPTTAGYNYVYHKDTNRFELVEKLENAKASDWIFVDAKDAENKGYSVYLVSNNENKTELNVNAGIDVGEQTITTINYTNTASAQDVVIRTNGGKLEINDASNDGKIYHYGYAGLINVLACADHSYYECGTTNILDVTDGHIVLTKDAVINKEVHFSLKENATAYAGDIILTIETSEMPAFTRDTLGTSNIPTQLVCEVKDNSSSEFIWVKETGVESEFVVTNNNSTPTASNTITANSKVSEVVNDIANIKNGENPVEDKGLTSAQKEANNEAAENGKYVKVTNLTTNVSYLTSIEDIATLVNSGDSYDFTNSKIELLSNMKLNNNWEPIGKSSKLMFTGCKLFDGNGYTISGIKYTGTGTIENSSGATIRATGLFGYVYGSIEFKDVNVKAEISTSYADGGFAAFVGVHYNKTITDVTSDDFPILSFKNCNAYGDITGVDACAGFVGEAKHVKLIFENCNNYLNVSGVGTGICRIAGFVGTAYVGAEFNNCNNYGTIHGKSTGNNVCAGFFGMTNAYDGLNITFIKSKNYGKVESDKNYGTSNIKIQQNYIGISQCPGNAPNMKYYFDNQEMTKITISGEVYFN